VRFFREKLGIIVCCLLALCLAHCDRGAKKQAQGGEQFATVDSALDAYAHMLSDLALLLTQERNSSQIEAKLISYFKNHSEEIEDMYQSLARQFSAMSEQDVMQSHASFIQRAEVQAFLDAQDNYRTKHGDESANRVDMLLSELYILSE